jgi:ABC-type multidrug transport system ATPase subunit
VDPLLEFMTSTETLLFYGRLKGLPKAGLDAVVKKLIKRVGTCLV